MSRIPYLILKFQWAKRCCLYAGVYGNCNQLSLIKCKNPSIASLHSSHKTEDKRVWAEMKVVGMEERRKAFLLLLPSPHLPLPLYVCNAIYTLSLLKLFTQILYCHKSSSFHPFNLLLTLVFWMDRVALFLNADKIILMFNSKLSVLDSKMSKMDTNIFDMYGVHSLKITVFLNFHSLKTVLFSQQTISVQCQVHIFVPKKCSWLLAR